MKLYEDKFGNVAEELWLEHDRQFTLDWVFNGVTKRSDCKFIQKCIDWSGWELILDTGEKRWVWEPKGDK